MNWIFASLIWYYQIKSDINGANRSNSFIFRTKSVILSKFLCKRLILNNKRTLRDFNYKLVLWKVG